MILLSAFYIIRSTWIRPHVVDLFILEYMYIIWPRFLCNVHTLIAMELFWNTSYSILIQQFIPKHEELDFFLCFRNENMWFYENYDAILKK